MRKLTPKPLTEDEVEQSIRGLAAAADCAVYSTSQGYRREPGGTRMTPGIPDLLLYVPTERGIELACFEVKTPAGLADHYYLAQLHAPPVLPSHRRATRDSITAKWRRAKAQQRFRLYCLAARIPYGIGGVPEFWQLLGTLGLTRETQTERFLLHLSKTQQHAAFLRAPELAKQIPDKEWPA